MMKRQRQAGNRGMSRREFCAASGVVAAAWLNPGHTLAVAESVSANATPAESFVADLYRSLDSDQRKSLCFAFDDKLRSVVKNNWKIVEPQIKDLKPAQRDLVARIVRGLCSEDGHERFMQQMADDYDGLENYHIALFGNPTGGKFEFVLSGRHNTMRADGNSVDKVAFGGPMFYGHAANDTFNEKPDHPGNVFWYQAKRANEVFAALDPKQREVALLPQEPKEDKINFERGNYPGIAAGSLSPDQKELLNKVMADLLSPYRKEDADEVMKIITANGGMDRIHLAFYRSGDIGNDGVWDVWRLEGPGFVWHFRGSPHVHTWVNIAQV